MKWITASLMFFSLISHSKADSSNFEKLQNITNLKRLAFGSCNKQFKQQVLWKDILKQSPDLFIWGGDNIYANTDIAEKIQADYILQDSIGDYRRFKAATPLIGTWDDHDYGNDNEDGNYPHKKISQQYFLDFMEVPKDSPRRYQEGIYTSYTFGETGKKVKIIVLDNRYFLNLDYSYPLLGTKQWRWLQDELMNSDANLHLIVSGLSVISPQHSGTEEWADFTFEKMKLKAFLQFSKVPYLYLSGDKHFSSIFTSDGELEFMSSGMTHNSKLPMRPWIKSNYPRPVFLNNYGLIDFDWENSNPVLKLTIRTMLNQNAVVKKVKWTSGSWKDL